MSMYLGEQTYCFREICPIVLTKIKWDVHSKKSKAITITGLGGL
jgi:hypothetical protein